MRKKRTIIGVLILCLSVGFASIATNLIINNTTSIGKNINDFDVYFSGAILDGVDKSNELINKSNKKDINFISNNLLFTDSESILEYEITNNSSNYDASVNIKCEYTSEDTSTNNRITITENPTSLTIEAKSIGNGNITAKLNEMATEIIDVPILCTLTANAVERTSKDIAIIEHQPYSISGYFVNEEGNAVSNGYLAVYSETKHIVRTDLYGYFYVDNLERGMHEIYYLNDLNPESMSKEEIESQSKGKINISTNHEGVITLSNGYKITDVSVGNKENTHTSYNITLNKDNGEDNEILEVTQNTLYGSLPIPERTGYNFLGWYLSDKIIDENVMVTESKTHTLVAHWDPKKYTITFNANGGSLTNKDELTKEVTYKGSYGSLPEATRSGYTLSGWYTSDTTQDETTKVTKNDIYNIADNQNLYAKWTIGEYTLTYNANEGSVSPTSKNVTFNQEYGSLPTPSRSGYRFDGWYTSITGGEKVETSTTLTSEGATIYAHWTQLGTLTLTKKYASSSDETIYYSIDNGESYQSTRENKVINDIPVGTKIKCYTSYWCTAQYNSKNNAWTGTMTASGLTYESKPSSNDKASTRIQNNSETVSLGGGYRYVGTDPNNYITFNCDDHEKRTNCETWRIIGVFDGRVKVIRDKVENTIFHASSNVYMASDIKTFVEGKVKADALNYIDAVQWNIGAHNQYSANVDTYRSLESASKSSATKIGLMYPSDYGYSYKGLNDSYMNDLYNNGYSLSTKSWLYKGGYEWTISPRSSDSNIAFRVTSVGFVSSNSVGNSYGARPVVYLSSSTKLAGNGTIDDPYFIYNNTCIY